MTMKIQGANLLTQMLIKDVELLIYLGMYSICCCHILNNLGGHVIYNRFLSLSQASVHVEWKAD